MTISINTLDGYLKDVGLDEDTKTDILLLVDAYSDLILMADDMEVTVEDVEVVLALP